ncbi:MAG: hypothetical protein ABEJ06_01845 [Haloarculaceae archaeon]
MTIRGRRDWLSVVVSRLDVPAVLPGMRPGLTKRNLLVLLVYLLVGLVVAGWLVG